MDGSIKFKKTKTVLLTLALLTSTLLPPNRAYANGNYDGDESSWVETVMVLFIVFAVGKYTYDRIKDTSGSDGDGFSEKDSSSFALKYLLGPDSMEVFDNLSSEQARKAYTASFWKSHNDGPNSLKEEFETRVAFANRHFTNIYTPGWKTDRGRILILHGKP